MDQQRTVNCQTPLAVKYNDAINDVAQLASIRKILQTTQASVARKLGISKWAYAKLEKNEELGTISLNSLEAAAEALECELVYKIQRKTHAHPADVTWDKLIGPAMLKPWLKNCDQRRRAWALTAMAAQIRNVPEFRREHKWSRNKN